MKDARVLFSHLVKKFKCGCNFNCTKFPLISLYILSSVLLSGIPGTGSVDIILAWWEDGVFYLK